MWFVYIVRCADGTLYTGITRDLARRVSRTITLADGAIRYTRGRRPVALVYAESAPTRSAALRREGAIKRMRRQDKDALLRAASPLAAAAGTLGPR